MKRMKLAFVLAMACALSVLGMQRPLAADELNPANIPADAKWVLHFDMEQILGTQMAKEVRESRPRLVEVAREWIRQQYGIDPQNDLHTVTMFSRSYHSFTGTVILRADYDAEKVEADIRKKEDVQTTQWNDHTLYTLRLAKHRHETPKADEASGHDRSGGKQMTIALVDNTTVVFASSVENAQETLKLLNGDGESLEGSDSKLLSGDWKGAMVYGAAIDLQEVEKSNIPMPVLKQHEQITWTFKESDGKLHENATLIAQSEEVAEQMEHVVRGILAYEKLWAAESESLRKIVEAAEVSREGPKVTVNWEGESQQVVDALEDLMARYREWKPLMRRGK